MSIDPIVLATAMLLGRGHLSRRPAPPPTPEQLAERAAAAERHEWNVAVLARKAAKAKRKKERE